MLAMESDVERIVAILHDVLENNKKITVDDLVAEDFSEEFYPAIVALTKLKDEPYEYYLHRVKSNPMALKVKLADLKDNMNLGRIANPKEKDLKRFQKYQKAYDFLTVGG